MNNVLKGLKKLGIGPRWKVEGQRGCYVIERERRGVYYVRSAKVPRYTLHEEFRRMAAARAWAEFQAGLADHAPTPRPPRRLRIRVIRFEASGDFDGRLETEPQPR